MLASMQTQLELPSGNQQSRENSERLKNLLINKL